MAINRHILVCLNLKVASVKCEGICAHDQLYGPLLLNTSKNWLWIRRMRYFLKYVRIREVSSHLDL